MTLSDEFLTKGRDMGKRLGLSFTQLLFVMNHESGLSPRARNPQGDASGLIQFMPQTLEGWGFSPEAFRALSAEEQLPYVERFLRPLAKHKLDSVGRIHQAIFVPASLPLATGPHDAIVRRGGTRYGGAEHAFYEANKNAFDRANKGSITPQDLEDADMRAAKDRGITLRDALLRLRKMFPEDYRVIGLGFVLSTIGGLALFGTAYWYFFERRGKRR